MLCLFVLQVVKKNNNMYPPTKFFSWSYFFFSIFFVYFLFHISCISICYLCFYVLFFSLIFFFHSWQHSGIGNPIGQR
jgi:hypothetical protein